MSLCVCVRLCICNVQLVEAYSVQAADACRRAVSVMAIMTVEMALTNDTVIDETVVCTMHCELKKTGPLLFLL